MVRAWMRAVYAAMARAVRAAVRAGAAGAAAGSGRCCWCGGCKPVLDRVVLHVLASGRVRRAAAFARHAARAAPRAHARPGRIAHLVSLIPGALLQSAGLAARAPDRGGCAPAAPAAAPAQLRATRVADHWCACSSSSSWRCPGSRCSTCSCRCRQHRRVPALPAVHLEGPWHAADRGVRDGLFAVMAIVEPFYVAGGFALYLNRRTALEGWDLEVALRRMGERAQAASRSAGHRQGRGAGALARRAAGAAAAREGHAQDTPVGGTEAEAQAQPGRIACRFAGAGRSSAGACAAAVTAACGTEIKEVLKRPEFDEYRERLGLEYLGKRQQPKPAKRMDAPGMGRIHRSARPVPAHPRVCCDRRWRWCFCSTTCCAGSTCSAANARPTCRPPRCSVWMCAPRACPMTSLPRRRWSWRAQASCSRRCRCCTGVRWSRFCTATGWSWPAATPRTIACARAGSAFPAPAMAYFARLLAAWQRLAYARRNVPRAEVEDAVRRMARTLRRRNPGAAA